MVIRALPTPELVAKGIYLSKWHCNYPSPGGWPQNYLWIIFWGEAIIVEVKLCLSRQISHFICEGLFLTITYIKIQCIIAVKIRIFWLWKCTHLWHLVSFSWDSSNIWAQNWTTCRIISIQRGFFFRAITKCDLFCKHRVWQYNNWFEKVPDFRV